MQTLGFLSGEGAGFHSRALGLGHSIGDGVIGDGVRGQGAVQGSVVLRGRLGAAFLSVRGVPWVRGSCVTLRHRPYRVSGRDLCDCPWVHLPGHSAPIGLSGLPPVYVPRPLCCQMWATPGHKLCGRRVTTCILQPWARQDPTSCNKEDNCPFTFRPVELRA